jgi:hypothetical protein
MAEDKLRILKLTKACTVVGSLVGAASHRGILALNLTT